MKHLKNIFACMLMAILSIGQVWADTETTYIFTSKSWGAKIGTTTANWTSGQDGAQFNTSGTPAGLQVTKNASGANGTTPKSFTNVKSVKVVYNSSSKGVGSISVQIGTNTALDAQSIEKSQTDKELVFTPKSQQTGAIKVTGTCTTNSFSFVSVTIVEAGSDQPTVFLTPFFGAFWVILDYRIQNHRIYTFSIYRYG